MATPVLICHVSVSEYLNTSYRPDCDYVNGEVLERNVGEKPHGLLQGILHTIFVANQRPWQLLPVLEQRVQVGPNRFRVPDLCLIDPADPDFIVRHAPFLCVEILSKDDSIRSMQERIDDYLGMGVKHIWLIDPVLRRAWMASESGLKTAEEILFAHGSPVQVGLAGVFTTLDDLLAGRL